MAQTFDQWLCPFCKANVPHELSAGPHPLTGKRFCPSCGEQLWATCKCGQSLRFDDETCSQCGSVNPIYIGGRA
ncbi:hypothetical protein JXL21_14515 [Candidatus Bathyarchaeota archaeon]|nr:hypothetical protein [Candidatus Bathyarchaeota archaeon]